VEHNLQSAKNNTKEKTKIKDSTIILPKIKYHENTHKFFFNKNIVLGLGHSPGGH
jgi:hypothetical protein